MLGVWVLGCVGVGWWVLWVLGCFRGFKVLSDFGLGLWVCGCVGVWVFGFAGVWVLRC